MPVYQPQQADTESEAWSVHRPSQSPNVLTQAQVNWIIVLVFCTSFVLNLITSDTSRGSDDLLRLENYVIVVVMTLMVVMWTVLIVKIRECIYWPDELSFRRDGHVVLEIGCGEKVLDCRQGVVLLRKRSNFCNSNLGVWCNTITDKSRDEVFVLVPSQGQRFWKGFAFQPEDSGAFLHDCRHAGIVIQDDDESNVAMVDASESLEEGLLRAPRLVQSSRTDLTQTSVGYAQREQDELSDDSEESEEDREDTLWSSPQRDHSPENAQSKDFVAELKNNNIISV